MKILTVDVGTGTQDIFLYDSQLHIENGFKLVVPSPTMIVHRQVKAATQAQNPILLTGVMMGGGPSAWAVEAHARAGLHVYATPGAAKTLNDELEKGHPAVTLRPRPRTRLHHPESGSHPPIALGAERKLLLLLVQFRDYVDFAAERLGPEEFSDPAYRGVFQALVEDPELAGPTAGLQPAVTERLEELLGDPERLSEASRVFEDTVGQIKEAQLASRADQLRAEMKHETDPAKQKPIAQELEEIARLRREMKQDWRPAMRRRQDPFDLSRE